MHKLVAVIYSEIRYINRAEGYTGRAVFFPKLKEIIVVHGPHIRVISLDEEETRELQEHFASTPGSCKPLAS